MVAMGCACGGVMLMCSFLHLLLGLASGNVVLIGRNMSKSFSDIEAGFTPRIQGSGISGVLHLAEPLDACTPLTNKAVEDSQSAFALIVRGICKFDAKVKYAQNAGFKAAIVYDDKDSGVLVSMEGTPTGISIPAVFVSKASGEVLKKYVGCRDLELWIIPAYENSAWSIMAISFISLLTMSAVLATCFFMRRHRRRHERSRASHVREFHGMSSQLVKAMPSLNFTAVTEDNCTSATCAICLEDYAVGEKLRVLPCRHKFHAFCVDSWLTTWRSFCPICKQDAKTSMVTPPASERTPLVSSTVSIPSPSSGLSSFRSSFAASPPLDIVVQHPPRPPSNSQSHSLSNSLLMLNPHRSFINSAPISISRSLSTARNASSHGSNASYLMSLHSLGFPLSSPINSRHMRPYIPSSSGASSSYLVGSASRRSYLRDCCESGTSL